MGSAPHRRHSGCWAISSMCARPEKFQQGVIVSQVFSGCKIWLTLPETTSEFTPENGWLEDDPFLLGPDLFSGAMVVLGRVPHIFVSFCWACCLHVTLPQTQIPMNWMEVQEFHLGLPDKPQTLIQNVYINVNTLLGRITHALLSWHFWRLHDFPAETQFGGIWLFVSWRVSWMQEKLNPFASDILDALSKACWLDLFCDP